MSPAATKRAPTVSGPTPGRVIRPGAVSATSGRSTASSSAISTSTSRTRRASDRRASLVALTTSVRPLGRRPAALFTNRKMLRPRSSRRSSSGGEKRLRSWLRARTRSLCRRCRNSLARRRRYSPPGSWVQGSTRWRLLSVERGPMRSSSCAARAFAEGQPRLSAMTTTRWPRRSRTVHTRCARRPSGLSSGCSTSTTTPGRPRVGRHSGEQ